MGQLRSILELSKWVGTQIIPIHHRFGSGYVELFYKFQNRLIFDLTYLEPSSPTCK